MGGSGKFTEGARKEGIVVHGEELDGGVEGFGG